MRLTITLPILASDVPIKLTPASAQERQIAGATEGSTAFKIRIPYWQAGTPIKVAPLPGSGTKIDAVAEHSTDGDVLDG
jgi:hypothetical protein